MKIFVCNDCSPELVELQVASFHKNMMEDYEFIMYVCDQNISKTPEKAQEVADICRRLGVEVREIPRDREIEEYWLSIAPGYHLFQPDGKFCRGVGGDTFNYMLQYLWQRVFSKEQGPICFCHSDVFLMEPIKLSDYLKGYSLVSVVTRNKGLTYLWEPLMILNPQELPEMETMKWWPSLVEGIWTDTGGPTHFYLKAHPEIKIREIGQSGIEDDPNVDFHPARYAFFHLGDKRVFHYYSASRWCTLMSYYWSYSKEQSDDYHARKLAWTRKFLCL